MTDITDTDKATRDEAEVLTNFYERWLPNYPNLRVSILRQEVCDAVLRVEARFLARRWKEVTRQQYEPDGPWQRLREAHAPAWWLRWSPVRKRLVTQVEQHYTTCPHLPIQDKRTHLDFLLLRKPEPAEPRPDRLGHRPDCIAGSSDPPACLKFKPLINIAADLCARCDHGERCHDERAARLEARYGEGAGPW